MPGFLARHPFWILIRPHWKRYVIGLVSLIMVDAINVVLPLVVRDAIDALIPKDMNRVLWAGGFYIGLMLFQAVGRYLWRVYLIGTSHTVATQLRFDLYGHFQRLPLQYYQKVRTGDLMSRATNDIESVRMALGPGILVAVDAALMFLLIVPVMFYLSWKLALFAFAFYPIVPFLTAKLGDRIDEIFELLQRKMSQLSAHAQESFGAIRLIKSLVLESKVYDRFWRLSKEYEKDGVILAKYQAVFSPTLTLLTSLGTFLILLWGGLDVMQGALTLGTFVAFQRFVVQLSWPMEAVGWAVTMAKEGKSAHRRLNEILHSPQVVDVLSERVVKPVRAEQLSISELSYAYGNGDGTADSFSLKLSDLYLEKGTKVGLVGPVGSGKSTLFNLILRLYEPNPGSIYFEGRDVTAIPLPELRAKIASVEQQVFLFSERIWANIALGSGSRVSKAAAIAAAEVACISDEVLELENGFETFLGERGVNLSGGQKQRIALARALAREPDLLLLDDCFSAVDVDIENRIIENFFSKYQNLSVCFSSHRLSVMPRMDEIWLIHQGQIVSKGTHAQLLRGSTLYQNLWEKSERQKERELFEAPAEPILTSSGT